MVYEGTERRAAPVLTEEQIEAIAERAAERALEKVYASIGKSVVTRFLWAIGIAVLTIVVWVKGGSLIK